MSKIAYLLGAGASYPTLPLVKQIPERLNYIAERLKEEKFLLSDTDTFKNLKGVKEKSKRQYQMIVVKKLKWLADVALRHASIDTYAKKLYLRGDTQLLKDLKIALSVYFVLEQSYQVNAHSRYDAFLASILKSTKGIPEEISIITWNYDYQFELAFSEYIGSPDIETSKRVLGVSHKYGMEDNPSRGQLFKLNGTTGFYNQNNFHHYYFANRIAKFNTDIINMVVENFALASIFDNATPTLSFAWENEGSNYSVVQDSIEAVKDCEVLVVIGYSFPFFNREIDRQIFKGMLKLKKIYIQDPAPQRIGQRLSAVTNVDSKGFIYWEDTSQFGLPDEL